MYFPWDCYGKEVPEVRDYGRNYSYMGDQHRQRISFFFLMVDVSPRKLSVGSIDTL